MQGFLDKVDVLGGAGWSYAQGDNSSVDVYINDFFYSTIKCDVIRKDLQNAGISHSGLGGFEFKANLSYLDKISIFCHKSGEELNHSPQFVMVDNFVSIQEFEESNLGKRFTKILNKISIFEKVESNKRSYLCKPVFNSYDSLVGLCFQSLESSDMWVELLKDESSAKKIIATKTFLTTLPVPSPKVLASEKVFQNLIIAFEYIEGNPSTHFNASQTIFNKGFVKKLNNFVVMVNKFSPVREDSKTKLMLNKNAFYAKHVKKVIEKAFNLIKAGKFSEAWFLYRLFLKIAKNRKCFSHGDLHPDNVIIDKQGELSIVDWDEYGLYPVGYDLATFYRSNLIIEKYDFFVNLVEDYCTQMGLQKTMQKNAVAFTFFGVCYLRFILNKTQTLQTDELEKLQKILKGFE